MDTQMKTNYFPAFCILAALLTVFLFSGCMSSVKRDIEKEIHSLVDNPGTASGSDLMLVLCGWPATMKLELQSLTIDLDPQSDSKSGSGFAELHAEHNGTVYQSKISFTYFKSYTGGHGYSGSNEISVSNLTRESDVDSAIGNPGQVHTINIGEKLNGEFNETSLLFPDGLTANFYSVNLPEDAAIKIILERVNEKSSVPTGYIYQNNKLISVFGYSGNRLKGGRTILMVCSRELHSKYSILVEQLDEKTKSMFIKPKR
jgi:hypothetical protein